MSFSKKNTGRCFHLDLLPGPAEFTSIGINPENLYLVTLLACYQQEFTMRIDVEVPGMGRYVFHDLDAFDLSRSTYPENSDAIVTNTI